MGPRLLACLCLLGCGRVGFDARSDSGASGDASFPTGPFGPAMPILELNSAYVDDDPSMTADGLELYFVSNRITNDQLHVTRRVAIDAPWGVPEPVCRMSSTAASS